MERPSSDIRDAPTLSSFQSRLKTFLLTVVFNQVHQLSAPVLTELLSTLITDASMYASVRLFVFMCDDMNVHILCLYNCVALVLLKHIVLLSV